MVSGFVLTLDNITRNFEREPGGTRCCIPDWEGSRSSLANPACRGEMLEYPDSDSELRERFLRVIRDEVQGMRTRLDETANAFADSPGPAGL